MYSINTLYLRTIIFITNLKRLKYENILLFERIIKRIFFKLSISSRNNLFKKVNFEAHWTLTSVDRHSPGRRVTLRLIRVLMQPAERQCRAGCLLSAATVSAAVNLLAMTTTKQMHARNFQHVAPLATDAAQICRLITVIYATSTSSNKSCVLSYWRELFVRVWTARKSLSDRVSTDLDLLRFPFLSSRKLLSITFWLDVKSDEKFSM
jgi:hypothetical protein